MSSAPRFLLLMNDGKQTTIGQRSQSCPAAIASLTACAKTRSASNRANSVKMPGWGAGDSATVPEIMWPSIRALRRKVFLFGFFAILRWIRCTGSVANFLFLGKEWTTPVVADSKHALTCRSWPRQIPHDRDALTEGNRLSVPFALAACSAVLPDVLPLQKSVS